MVGTLSALMQGADSAAEILGFKPKPLDAGLMVKSAEKAAGRTFRDLSFFRPLCILLKSYNEESSLSLFGGLAVKWDIARFLGNVLRLEAEEEAHPEILDEVIARPIFITGLPRSGTTFLHTLLGQDTQNRVPLSWQTIYPYPEKRDARRDGRRARVDQQLRMFERLSPGVSKLHPMAAITPQECTEITAHVFQSLRFDTTHYVPSYQNWLIEEGHSAAFRFHKKFLQHLQHQQGRGQWVLKCPDHVFTLDAILEVYPDAQFVFVHRDPMSVLPSVAKLTEMLRAPFTRKLDTMQIGRQVCERWVEGADLIAGDQARHTAQDFHIHYRTLVSQPEAAVEQLYAHFGIEFSATARAAVRRFVQNKPRGGYGVNRYDFAQAGLDPATLYERFHPYMTAFGIEHEWGRSGESAVSA